MKQFNATKNCSIFKNYFSSLAQDLIPKLPLSPNTFTESKIASYYDNNAVPKNLNFQLLERSPENILSILKGLNISKAAGIENLSGKFLKGGAHVFARSISQFCSLSIKLNSFPRSCKIAKVKSLFKKALRRILKTITLFHPPSPHPPCYQKSLKGLLMTKQKSF